jgi:hypothetical protein
MMSEITPSEEKRRRGELLAADDWATDLCGSDSWTPGNLCERESWQMLPIYNPKARKIRRRIELVE